MKIVRGDRQCWRLPGDENTMKSQLLFGHSYPAASGWDASWLLYPV
jgi:hypothetical protein